MANLNGDINGDGVLDHVDLDLLKQVVQEFKTFGAESSFIHNLSEQQLNALDVNKDGKIDYDDVVLLCQKLIHQPQMTTENSQDRFALLRQRLHG